MGEKQIATLFICSLILWTVGNGLVPLLPIYAKQFGASQAMAGNYMAFSYLAISISSISSGWVSEKLQKRKIPIIIAGLVGIPTTWAICQAGDVFELSILTALLWFYGGLGIGLIGILAG